MAKKARDPVQFTFESAERIARVVRSAELATPQASPLTFDPFLQDKLRGAVKLATFTGSWQTGQFKTVTLHGVTHTARVFNWCNPSLVHSRDTANTAIKRFVIFGKCQGTNSVVEIQSRYTSSACTTSLQLGTLDLTSIPGYEAGQIQLLGHAAGGTQATACVPQLTWYSVTTCSTAAS